MMATAEERMKILKMIQDGKITAEEGARLLAALKASSGAGRRRVPDRDVRRRQLRIRVTDMKTGKTKVNVTLPLGLLDAGMNIATRFVPGMGLEDLQEELYEAIRTGLEGRLIDVLDETDRERVEIFIE